MFSKAAALILLLTCLLSAESAGQQAAGKLLFCKRSKAEAGVYLVDPDGRNLKKIMFLCGPDVCPRFAPDGQRILFASPRAGKPWLWIASREGEDRKAICEGDQGTWSADGSSIFFRRGAGIVRRELASGQEHAVSPPGWQSSAFPDCSPDGKRLLFCADREGRTKLLVMTLEGKALRVIAELGAASPARWSPDGQRIAYSDGASILIADADGGRTYPLAAHGGADCRPAWSPDGATLVYCHASAPRGGQLLCLSKADGTSARLLPKGTLTEPGRDGLVRSNPRLLPYEDNVLTVFAPDWRGASIAPAPSAAALRPPTRVQIWEVGGEPPPTLAQRREFLEKREGWKQVSGAVAIRGALAVENERVILIFGAGRGPAILCSKPLDKQSQIVELLPISRSGEEARMVESLTLTRNDGQQAVVALSSSTPTGQTVNTSWKIEGDWPVAHVAAAVNAKSLRVEAPLRYAAVPDRFADDLVYEPSLFAGPRVALPIAPMTVGLLGSGDAELVVICASRCQTMDLLKDAGRDQPFLGVEARFPGRFVIVGLLAGPKLWHAERPQVKYERKRINLNWEMPEPRAWRLVVRAGGRDYSEMFDENQSQRYDGARLFLTEHEPFAGVVELALVYLYGGSPGTPPDRLSPADLALHGMGIESFLRVMDVEGLQTYRTAPRETAWADIFATLESIRYLYDNEVEKQEAEYVAHLCEDVPAFLEGMDNRLGEFTEFADEVARLATNPEAATGSSLATASSVATAIGPALGKLEDACKRRDELPAASEAAAWAAEMEELTRKDAPDKKKQFSDLYQRLLAAARGRADAIRAFRGAARELSNAAGYACAERPKLYPTALWLRTHAQGVLRNRYYFEDDWRGELQRPPPFWLGPSPY